jgi:hypothetical protein
MLVMSLCERRRGNVRRIFSVASFFMFMMFMLPARAQTPYKYDLPPQSESGSECDATNKNCLAWVKILVPRFEHAGPGVNDPPCATNPQEAVSSISSAIVTGGIAIGAAAGGVPGAIAGGIIGAMITTAATPDTPLGQLINPPSNKARCMVVGVVIPAGARRIGRSLWTDNLAERPRPSISLAGMAVKVIPHPDSANPQKWPLHWVDADRDLSYAKFDGEPRESPIMKDGKHIGTLVWTVYKNWAGGLDRVAGMNVPYVMR